MATIDNNRKYLAGLFRDFRMRSPSCVTRAKGENGHLDRINACKHVPLGETAEWELTGSANRHRIQNLGKCVKLGQTAPGC